MRWGGHADRMKAMRNKYNILVGNLREEYCSEDLGVNKPMKG
jgi:hypothetical protein